MVLITQKKWNNHRHGTIMWIPRKLPRDVPHTPHSAVLLSVDCGLFFNSHFESEFSSSKIMRNNFFVCARNNSKQATEKCFLFKNRNPLPISTFASFYITGSLSTTTVTKTSCSWKLFLFFLPSASIRHHVSVVII